MDLMFDWKSEGRRANRGRVFKEVLLGIVYDGDALMRTEGIFFGLW